MVPESSNLIASEWELQDFAWPRFRAGKPLRPLPGNARLNLRSGVCSQGPLTRRFASTSLPEGEVGMWRGLALFHLSPCGRGDCAASRVRGLFLASRPECCVD